MKLKDEGEMWEKMWKIRERVRINIGYWKYLLVRKGGKNVEYVGEEIRRWLVGGVRKSIV